MKFSPLNLVSITLILLLIAVGQSIAQTTQDDNRPRTASIGGQVTIGGKPAANVTVKIVESDLRSGGEFFSTSSATATSEPRTFNVVTDAGGRYRLAGLAAGTYQVSAASKAYVLAKQNTDIEPARRITLDGDEAREDVDLSLARGGVITGRVTTFNGRPMIATRVWLHAVFGQGDRAEYRSHGDQRAEMFGTDDRGVYRIYGLPAGRYVVSAGGGNLGAANDPARDYRGTYFRDAKSGSKAAIIEVKEGGEITDVDIRLGNVVKTYEASGRLIEAETGKPMSQSQVWAAGFDKGNEEDGGPLATSFGRSIGARTDDQGNFRLTGLTPGRYSVSFSGSWGDRVYYSDEAWFEVVDNNVEGLEVKARRAVTISGVAVIEGPVDPNLRTLLFAPDAINIDTIQVTEDSRSVSRSAVTSIKPNGEFRVPLMEQGSGLKAYFVANQWKVKGLRALRVELNGVEAPDGIEVNPGQQITGVRVVFTQASGAIRGQVKFIGALPENADLTAVVTSTLERIASPGDRDPTEAGVDGKGRFVFDALFPGEYEVKAYLKFRIGRSTIITSEVESPTRRVTVTNGQEAPVELTIDLSKTNQEKRQ